MELCKTKLLEVPGFEPGSKTQSNDTVYKLFYYALNLVPTAVCSSIQ